MAFLAPALPFITAAAAVGSTAVALTSGPGKPPAPPPQVMRDDAASMIGLDDRLLLRRGGAADILNGDAGISTPLSGPKLLLGQ